MGSGPKMSCLSLGLKLGWKVPKPGRGSHPEVLGESKVQWGHWIFSSLPQGLYGQNRCGRPLCKQNPLWQECAPTHRRTRTGKRSGAGAGEEELDWLWIGSGVPTAPFPRYPPSPLRS